MIFQINLLLIITNIPLNYYNVVNCKDHLEWENAINVELNNLYNNKIFSFVKFVPKNKNLISTKWVFTNKIGLDKVVKRKTLRCHHGKQNNRPLLSVIEDFLRYWYLGYFVECYKLITSI